MVLLHASCPCWIIGSSFLLRALQEKLHISMSSHDVRSGRLELIRSYDRSYWNLFVVNLSFGDGAILRKNIIKELYFMFVISPYSGSTTPLHSVFHALTLFLCENSPLYCFKWMWFSVWICVLVPNGAHLFFILEWFSKNTGFLICCRRPVNFPPLMNYLALYSPKEKIEAWKGKTCKRSTDSCLGTHHIEKLTCMNGTSY